MNRLPLPLPAIALATLWAPPTLAHGPDASVHYSLHHYLTSPDHVALILAAVTGVVVLVRALLPRRAKQRAAARRRS